jgi:hypothetical protein
MRVNQMKPWMESEPPEPARDPDLQRALADFQAWRLRPALPEDPGAHLDVTTELALRDAELCFVEHERAAIAPQAALAPQDPEGFLAWFESLQHDGPGQGDPLFPWLATAADVREVRWFLAQEVAGEAGFDDLLALTQLKMPAQVKLEMARNFWDEQGRGHASGMHGPMLQRLALALDATLPMHAIVPESLALANLLTALATHRRYAYHSIGALGAIELTAPGRAEQVDAALRRLAVSAQDRQYFSMHASLDKLHSAAWNREVVRVLVAADPRTARAMAEGAMMRLAAGARCFERYRRELRLVTPGEGAPAHSRA